MFDCQRKTRASQRPSKLFRNGNFNRERGIERYRQTSSRSESAANMTLKTMKTPLTWSQSLRLFWAVPRFAMTMAS